MSDSLDGFKQFVMDEISDNSGMIFLPDEHLGQGCFAVYDCEEPQIYVVTIRKAEAREV